MSTYYREQYFRRALGLREDGSELWCNSFHSNHPQLTRKSRNVSTIATMAHPAESLDSLNGFDNG